MPLSTFLDGRDRSSRGLLWLALSDTGVLRTRTSVSDSGGGVTQTWGTAGTVPCRVAPIGRDRQGRMTGGAVDERSTHVITVPAGSTVTADDRFVVAGRGTFEVTAVHQRTAEWATFFEAVQVS